MTTLEQELSIGTMRDTALDHFAHGRDKEGFALIDLAREYGQDLGICLECLGQGYFVMGTVDDMYEAPCPYCHYNG